MSRFTPPMLEAIRLLLDARLTTVSPLDPSRPKWEDTRAAVAAELARCKPGARVFALDLPLSVTLPPPPPREPKPPRARKKPLTAKQQVKAEKAAKKRAAKAAKRGPPKPIVIEPAPRLNVYANLESFQKTRIRRYLDGIIEEEKARWPDWHWGGTMVTGREDRQTPAGGRRRLVRLTRFTSRRPDEMSVDVLGGKLPVDCLVEAKVLGGDSDVWIERDARWEAARPGEGRVLVEVFELLGEAGEPKVKGRAKRVKAAPERSSTMA